MLRKNAIKLLVLFFVFCLFSILSWNIPVNGAEMFYTIGGIIFSIGLSRIMSFDFIPIKNDVVYKELTENIDDVKNGFFLFFFLSSIAILVLIMAPVIPEAMIWKFSFKLSNLCMIIILYSIAYFIINFETMYKTKMKLDKRLREENE